MIHLCQKARDGRLSSAGIAEEDHVGGAGTARLVGEGDAKHGWGEATDASAVVVEEGFAEVKYVGGSTEPLDLICWLGMEGQISVGQKVIPH